MTIEQTPAAARTDVRRPAAVSGTTRPTRPFRKRGMLLTAGALSWALAMVVMGSDPHGATEEAVFSLASGLFQIGVMGLLTVLWQTQALGEGRVARFFLRLEGVLLSLAICSTFVDGISVSDLDQTGWLLLDLTWPLSMMGMFFIGIRIAIAGRWRGVSRFWPLVAESWAVVSVPAYGIFGGTVAGFVGAAHLCIGYAVLGQIVARKEG
ncbi:hypothetical protein GON03_20830 [Nocardioides sp. MAH-18]|uniref:Uncharacterized protein n=1 Tax=Nocardioides agri TaxID=2682843 RepID=A0A6L6XXW3_9ACTN|nr:MULTISPECIES: hypothetical protein [unclassified Nocardioides]MBA2952470.1 hypothetical protein [Nocardioides sp. CGMCC 1.13656]MVQ51632.1 hypothetical protein [Nocardioides sp. MAH-18]